MSIGSTANDIFFMVIASLAGLLLLSVMVGLGALIGRRNARLGVMIAFLPALIALLLGVAVLSSIDSLGKTVTGTITRKDEFVAIAGAGTWSHYWEVEVNYRADGSAPGAFSSAINATIPKAGDASAKLNLRKPDLFDKIRVGEPIKLTLMPLVGGTALVKLSTANTSDFISLNVIGGLIGLLALGWLLFKVANSSNLGCGISAFVFLLIAVGGPVLYVYQDWRALDDISSKPLRANATITDVTQVKCIRPFDIVPRYQRTAVSTLECARRGVDIETAQPFKVIQMRFTPPNQPDVVIAVDAVDNSTVPLEKGGNVQIAYSADNPRAAHIVGSAHSHRWRNVLGYLGALSLSIIVVVGLLSLGLLRRRAKRVGAPSR